MSLLPYMGWEVDEVDTAAPRTDVDVVEAASRLLVCASGNLSEATEVLVAVAREHARKCEDEPESMPKFSERELEILRMLGEGLKVKQISQELYISEHTVGNHIRAIRAEMGVETYQEAVMMARILRII